MKTIQKPLLLLALLASGCQTVDQRLLVAEKTLTVAQNGWADLLEQGVVRNRTSVLVGTAALNHADAAVARAYAARQQPTTRRADGKSINALTFWLDDVEHAVSEAVRTYEQIRAEETR